MSLAPDRESIEKGERRAAQAAETLTVLDQQNGADSMDGNKECGSIGSSCLTAAVHIHEIEKGLVIVGTVVVPALAKSPTDLA